MVFMISNGSIVFITYLFLLAAQTYLELTPVGNSKAVKMDISRIVRSLCSRMGRKG